MKRTIFFILSFIFACGQSYCFAQSAATTYKMTVLSVQMKDVATGTWVTIASPNSEVDIASVDANAVAASFASDVVIPVGSYDNFKIVLGESMVISGTDGGRYMSQDGVVTITGTNANAASTSTWANAPCSGTPANCTTLTETVESSSLSAGDLGEVTFTLDLDAGDADSYIEIYRGTDLTTPIVIESTSVFSLFFDFDVQNTIQDFDVGGGNHIFAFFPPQAGTQVGITVDGVVTTITESDMRIDF